MVSVVEWDGIVIYKVSRVFIKVSKRGSYLGFFFEFILTVFYILIYDYFYVYCF